mgnify:CR=1 FL=1
MKQAIFGNGESKKELSVSMEALLSMTPAQQIQQLKSDGFSHGATFTLDKQRYAFLQEEGLKPFSVLSERERRLFGLTKSRTFVSQKERLKNAKLTGYQAVVSGVA